jgi:hypothetical protein
VRATTFKSIALCLSVAAAYATFVGGGRDAAAVLAEAKAAGHASVCAYVAAAWPEIVWAA